MNMAALWKLPVIFCIENNMYGMGTSVDRSSCNTDYYTMGNVIPGIQVDGMNLLAIRSAMQKAKDHASNGNGPILVEMKTYRYHGHSMSDPGVTYRNRTEVSDVRKTRDPIALLKNTLIHHELANEDELSQIEKDVKKEIKVALTEAKSGSLPKPDNLYKKIYKNDDAVRIKMPLDYR